MRVLSGAVLGLVLVVAAPWHPAAGSIVRPYYLAIGASESLGVQPTFIDPHGQDTDHGYANDLRSIEARRWPGLKLEEVGCSGITIPEAVRGGGRCTFAHGTELSTAVGFLRAHRNSTVLVTVDLGFNDVRPCLEDFRVERSCVSRALAGVRATLPVVLRDLVAVAGPETHIVGLRHNNPFLADAGRPATESFSDTSAVVLAELNKDLEAIYRQNGLITADVPAAFDRAVTRIVAPGSTGSRGVCALTWMCARAPFGPNLHPDSAGYHLIADSIATALDRALGPAR